MHTALIFADLGDPIWQFWIGVGSLILSTMAILLTVVIAVRNRRRKVLTYEVVSNSSVINMDNDIGENLTLLLDGRPVNNVRLYMIKVQNAGNQAISPEDYPNQLSFAFTSPPFPHPLIRGGIHRTEPQAFLQPHHLRDLLSIDAPEQTTMTFKPPLLNPRDTVFLKVLVMAKSRESTTMRVFGQIKDGAIKKYSSSQPRVTRRLVIAGVVIAFVLGLLIPKAISLVGAFTNNNCAVGSITVDGSTSFYHTANAEAGRYLNNCPVARIAVNESSSGTGLQDLDTGNLSIANSEIAAPTDKHLLDHPVAVIVFALIVNRQANVSNLNLQQIQEIYGGKIHTWNTLDANATSIPITFFGRAGNSGTRVAFEHYVLQGQTDLTPPQNVLDRSSDVVSTVARTPGAIGYADLGDALASNNVTILNINQYAPSAPLIEKGRYPFWAVEHMYTSQNPDGLSSSFIAYVKQDLQTRDTFVSLNFISNALIESHL